MKKLIALFIAAVSVVSVFSFTACGGNNGVSDSKLEKIRSSQSDKVDLEAWANAFTSEDIYNSTAVCKSESKSTYVTESYTTVDTSEMTITVYTDLINTDGVVTGNEYGISQYTSCTSESDELEYYNYNMEAYFIVGETSATSYVSQGDYYRILAENSEDGFGVKDTMMYSIYAHFQYSGGEFDGNAYSDFTYDEELGSYVYEYTSGNYTYDYELKFSDGNLVYYKIYTYYSNNGTSYTRESSSTVEGFYFYDDVEVKVSSQAQKRIDSALENK